MDVTDWDSNYNYSEKLRCYYKITQNNDFFDATPRVGREGEFEFL